MKAKTFLDNDFIKELKAGLIYPVKTVVSLLNSAETKSVHVFCPFCFIVNIFSQKKSSTHSLICFDFRFVFLLIFYYYYNSFLDASDSLPFLHITLQIKIHINSYPLVWNTFQKANTACKRSQEGTFLKTPFSCFRVDDKNGTFKNADGPLSGPAPNKNMFHRYPIKGLYSITYILIFSFT